MVLLRVKVLLRLGIALFGVCRSPGGFCARGDGRGRLVGLRCRVEEF